MIFLNNFQKCTKCTALCSSLVVVVADVGVVLSMSLDHGAFYRKATTWLANLVFRPRHACCSRSNHLEKKTCGLISFSSTMEKFVEASLC